MDEPPAWDVLPGPAAPGAPAAPAAAATPDSPAVGRTRCCDSPAADKTRCRGSVRDRAGDTGHSGGSGSEPAVQRAASCGPPRLPGFRPEWVAPAPDRRPAVDRYAAAESASRATPAPAPAGRAAATAHARCFAQARAVSDSRQARVPPPAPEDWAHVTATRSSERGAPVCPHWRGSPPADGQKTAERVAVQRERRRDDSSTQPAAAAQLRSVGQPAHSPAPERSPAPPGALRNEPARIAAGARPAPGSVGRR